MMAHLRALHDEGKMNMVRALLALFVAGTTAVERVPTSTVDTFPVSGRAGQTLLIEVNVDNTKADSGEHKIAVFDPASIPLASSLYDDTSVNRMRRLVMSGNYRVQIACPRVKPYTLRVTLLEANDPRLDPGIRLEQISITDPGHQITWSKVGFVPVLLELSDYGPAHWKSEGGTLDIEVLPIEGVRKAWWIDNAGPKAVARLEAALDGTGVIDPHALPGDLNGDAALTFATQARRIHGPGIRAVRWLGNYDQSDTSPVTPLTYAADGITSDGKLLVVARGTTGHRALPKDVLELEGARLRDYRRKMAQRLDGESATNFSPDLENLDAIVQSILVH
jgi:hypothetical protein